MTDKNKDRYLTAKDVAEHFMVSPITVKQWAQKGLIKARLTPGGHRRFSHDDIANFAETHNIELSKPLNSLNILVVDDDPHIRELLCDIFVTRLPKANVNAVDNGFKAGMIVKELEPDVILVDLMMPGINGFEVCQLIRNTPSLAQSRIVAMTGFPSEARLKKIIDAGAATCLTKPFSQQQVLEACELTPETAPQQQQMQQDVGNR